MQRRTGVFTFGKYPVTAAGTEIKVGDAAPDFTVINTASKPVKLSDYKGKVRILSVFPSIDTGVCAMQAVRFDKEAAALGENVVILAISVDLPFALRRHCTANNLNNLVPVTDHRHLDFALKYGFLMEELRLLARGVVVVDQHDVVRYVEYVHEGGNEPNYDAALAAVKSLL